MITESSKKDKLTELTDVVGTPTDDDILVFDGVTNTFQPEDFTIKFNTNFSGKTTDNLIEGTTNKYYSSSLFDSDFSGKTTDNLTEGTANKYYSSSLFDSDFSGKTTDNLIEGTTNKYYSSSLFDSDFSNKNLKDLNDVDNDISPSNGDILIWNDTNSYWTNSSTIDADSLDGYDSVVYLAQKSSTTPSNPRTGQLWWDTSGHANLMWIKIYDGSSWRKVVKKWIASTTINISSVNDFISVISLIENSEVEYNISLTLQFADGTYTFTSQPIINNFIVNGNFYLYGNTGETNASALHTTQNVTFDFRTNSLNGLVFVNCHFRNAVIRNIKFTSDSNNTSGSMLGFGNGSSGSAKVYYNYFEGNGTGNNSFGISIDSSPIGVKGHLNYFSNMYAGAISQWKGMYSCWGDDDAGTQPLYGRIARYGGLSSSIGCSINGSSANTTGDGILS